MSDPKPAPGEITDVPGIVQIQNFVIAPRSDIVVLNADKPSNRTSDRTIGWSVRETVGVAAYNPRAVTGARLFSDSWEILEFPFGEGLRVTVDFREKEGVGTCDLKVHILVMVRPGKNEWRRKYFAEYGHGGLTGTAEDVLQDLRGRQEWDGFLLALRTSFLAAEVLYL